MTKEEQELLTMIRNCKDPARAFDALLRITLACLAFQRQAERNCAETRTDRLAAV